MFGGSNQHPGKTEDVRDVTPGTFGGQEFIVSHSFLAATENSLLCRASEKLFSRLQPVHDYRISPATQKRW